MTDYNEKVDELISRMAKAEKFSHRRFKGTGFIVVEVKQ
jgi:hypothetical protein